MSVVGLSDIDLLPNKTKEGQHEVGKERGQSLNHCNDSDAAGASVRKQIQLTEQK